MAQLSIHHLAAPLLPNPTTSSPPSQTPTDLTAELTHYKDLFSKLRFSYTEQVTKERFLRSVASDPPELVSASDLALLEAKLVEDKAALKGKKGEVAALLQSLRGRSEGVAGRVNLLEKREGRMGEVRGEFEALEARRGELMGLRRGQSEDSRLNMGLEQTRGCLEERVEEAEVLSSRVEEVQREVERRRTDVERLRREMEGMEERKREAVREAMDMRRRRGSGVDEGMDEVEAKGRWARANEGVLRALN